MKRTNGSTQIEGIRKVRDSARSQGGVFRTGEAFKAGVHQRTLYTLRDQGVIEQLGRGMYRFTDMPTLGNLDPATVALKVPKGVIRLISALSWHEMTSETSHEIYLALLRGAEAPRLEHPQNGALGQT